MPKSHLFDLYRTIKRKLFLNGQLVIQVCYNKTAEIIMMSVGYGEKVNTCTTSVSNNGAC